MSVIEKEQEVGSTQHIETASIRRATRDMVRLLGVVQGTCAGLPFSVCHALLEIEAAGTTTSGDLADALCIDKSSASRMVTRLLQEGLVDRSECGEDSRRKPVALSDAGRAKLLEINAAGDGPVNRALDLMRPEERSRVMDGLQIYARALKRAERWDKLVIREIEPRDIGTVAAVIREVMTEYGAVGKGFSIEDPEVDDMYTAYQGDRHRFYVVELAGQIQGCGGIAPLKGADEHVCELQKMYFRPALRGLGAGSKVIQLSLDFAREAGFTLCYLETLETMERAARLYRGYGFAPIDAPLGATGHCGCDRFYTLDLTQG